MQVKVTADLVAFAQIWEILSITLGWESITKNIANRLARSASE
ncbi:hypothetical protein [Vibrio parahaemolyticus]|nr:hypothetical protein [Vibrio parahaemolyticus]